MPKIIDSQEQLTQLIAMKMNRFSEVLEQTWQNAAHFILQMSNLKLFFAFLSMYTGLYMMTPAFLSPQLELTMMANTEGEARVFFLTEEEGAYYSTANSAVFELSEETTRFEIALPRTPTRQIRIDPGSGVNKAVVINKIEIKTKKDSYSIAGIDINKSLVTFQQIDWDQNPGFGKLYTTGKSPVLLFDLPPNLYHITPSTVFSLFMRCLPIGVLLTVISLFLLRFSWQGKKSTELIKGIIAKALNSKLLLFSTTLAYSLIVGYFRTGIQSSVDISQNIAGIVSYPATDLFAMYQGTVFSLQNQIGAVLFKLGADEIAISYVFCALSIFFVTHMSSSIFFYFSRNSVLALLIGILLFESAFGNFFVNYELVMPPGQVTFAPFALMYLGWVLSQGLFSRRWLYGLVLLPAIHPYLGLWSIVAYISWKILFKTKTLLKDQVLLALLASFSAVALLYLLQVPISGTSVESATRVARFATKHRQPFPFDYTTICLFLSLICFSFILTQDKEQNELHFLIYFVVFFSFLGLTASAVYGAPSGSLQALISKSIPSRNPNLLSLALAPIILGFGFKQKQYVLLSLSLIALLASSTLQSEYLVVHRAEDISFQTNRDISLLISTLFLFVLHSLESTIKQNQAPIKIGHFFIVAYLFFFVIPGDLKYFLILIELVYLFPTFFNTFFKVRSTWALKLIIGVTLLTFVILDASSNTAVFASKRETRNTYYGNNPVMQAAKNGSGYLVYTVPLAFVQSRTQRPVLFDIQMSAAFIYIKEDIGPATKILREVYDINTLSQCPTLNCPSTRQAFETRSVAEWARLAKKYDFSGILTPASWKIKLDVKAKDNDFAYFELPKAF